MKIKRRKRGPNPWIIVGSVIGGIVVVGLIVVLVTSKPDADASANTSNDNAPTSDEPSPDNTGGSLFSTLTGQARPEPEDNENDQQSVFANLPSHPKLEVTDENWLPDPDHLNKLDPVQRAGEYVIRLPDQAASAHHLAKLMFPQSKGYDLVGGFVWKWPSPRPGQFYGITFSYYSWQQPGGPSPKELRLLQEGIVNPPPGILNRKTKRGLFRGLPAWYSTQETAAGGKRSYEMVIQAVDGEYNVGIRGLSPTPPGTPGYELVKAAMLSVHRK